MGLLKRFGRHRKPQEIEEVMEAVSTKEDKQQEKKKSVQHMALEYCEQLMTAAKDLEETRKEYHIVTDYLKDIQIIEQLPKSEAHALVEMAQKVQGLNQSRDAYLNKARTISDAQFAQMEKLESEIPDAVRRLQANEAYQNAVKRDMQYLEGEKSKWIYYQESLKREEGVLRHALYGVLGIAAAALVLTVIAAQFFRFKLQMPVLMIVLAAAAVSGGILLRKQRGEREQKRCQVNINQAIILENKVKLKYVNVTNAVDYACEKYHVRNAYELNYQWEQYMEAVQEQENYQQANEDLEYFSQKLIQTLTGYHLYDAGIWLHQVSAIVNKKEMAEVKHELLVRRKKLRTRIERQITTIQNAKAEINQMVTDYRQQGNEIKSVLESLDQMCRI